MNALKTGVQKSENLSMKVYLSVNHGGGGVEKGRKSVNVFCERPLIAVAVLLITVSIMTDSCFTTKTNNFDNSHVYCGLQRDVNICSLQCKH